MTAVVPSWCARVVLLRSIAGGCKGSRGESRPGHCPNSAPMEVEGPYCEGTFDLGLYSIGSISLGTRETMVFDARGRTGSIS